MTEQQRRERGIDHLPGSLWEAIEHAEGSDLLRRCLGDHLLESLLTNKKIEWSNFRRQVTDYELKRYLPILFCKAVPGRATFSSNARISWSHHMLMESRCLEISGRRRVLLQSRMVYVTDMNSGRISTSTQYRGCARRRPPARSVDRARSTILMQVLKAHRYFAAIDRIDFVFSFSPPVLQSPTWALRTPSTPQSL
jgi:hypothetical protein